MMNRYDRQALLIDFIAAVALVLILIEAIIRGFRLGGNLFSLTWESFEFYFLIAVAIFVSHILISNFQYYMKYRKVKHGIDERTEKVLAFSARNGFISVMVALTLTGWYHAITGKTTWLSGPIFITYIVLIGMIVFFASMRIYQKLNL